MKRILAAIIITLSMIILAFTGKWIAHSSIRHIQTVMVQIDAELAAGNAEQAIRTSESLLKDWDRYHGLMCLFLQHDHLEPLESTFALLPFYIQSGETFLARSECQNVCTVTEHILKTEAVTLENIL